jgi:hypothetical protein
MVIVKLMVVENFIYFDDEDKRHPSIRISLFGFKGTNKLSWAFMCLKTFFLIFYHQIFREA